MVGRHRHGVASILILNFGFGFGYGPARHFILISRVEQYDCYIRNSHVDMYGPYSYEFLRTMKSPRGRLIFPPNIIHCSRVLPSVAFKTPIVKGKGWQHSGAINTIFPPKH